MLEVFVPYDHSAILKKDVSGSRRINIVSIFRVVDELGGMRGNIRWNSIRRLTRSALLTIYKRLKKAFAFLKEQNLIMQMSASAPLYFELSQARIFVMEHNFDVADA